MPKWAIALCLLRLLIPAIGQTGTYIGYAIGGLLWLGVGGLTKFSPGSILLTVLFVTHA